MTQVVVPSELAPVVSSREQNGEHPSVEAARRRARAEGLAYAGAIDPESAYELFRSGEAILVDVRTVEERKFVGHVPDSVHVAWQTGTAMIKNPRFIKELSTKVPREAVVFFICRSGKRSADAAAAAAGAGFAQAFNVLEGFEGDLDANGQRGGVSGWRLRGLPWVQD
jgi:rhodanese-related sulfurtransferase